MAVEQVPMFPRQQKEQHEARVQHMQWPPDSVHWRNGDHVQHYSQSSGLITLVFFCGPPVVQHIVSHSAQRAPCHAEQVSGRSGGSCKIPAVQTYLHS